MIRVCHCAIVRHYIFLVSMDCCKTSSHVSASMNFSFMHFHLTIYVLCWQGGFDMICSGRDKIETPEQVPFLVHWET